MKDESDEFALRYPSNVISRSELSKSSNTALLYLNFPRLKIPLLPSHRIRHLITPSSTHLRSRRIWSPPASSTPTPIPTSSVIASTATPAPRPSAQSARAHPTRPSSQSLNILTLIAKMDRHPLYLRQTIPPIRTCLYTRRRKMRRLNIHHLVLDDWRFIPQHHAPTGTLPHTLRRRDFWRGNGASVMDLLSRHLECLWTRRLEEWCV
jgi:hypothetical protein